MAQQKLNRPVLVVAENEKSADMPTLSGASKRLIHLGRALTNSNVYVLNTTEEIDEDALRAAGADTIFVPEAQGYQAAVPAGVADMARSAIEQMGECGAVLMSATYLGRAAAAMVGAKMGAGTAVDVTAVVVEDDSVIASKSALGGSWTTQFRITEGFPVLAVRPGVGPTESTAGTGVLRPLTAPLSSGARAVEVISSEANQKSERIPLAEADVVVVGGRGVDGDFALVERLADAFGGAVGATRVACDEGWVDRSAQIGQTGFSIAPKLYIGIGVSGAVHHTCGMLGSETIVAIVDDPDAPILELADFAVVGDAHDVITQALETLETVR